MRGLVANKICPMMSDSRLAHASHRHHSHPSQSYPGHGPALAYPTLPSHPPYNSHASRQIHNGPLPPVSKSGHVQSGPMAGLPDGGGPSSVSAVGNGHAHGPPPPSGMSVAARAAKEKMESVLSQLATANENTWMLIGAVAEQMQDQDRALVAFENALRHNPTSILGLNAVASIARSRDNFDKAIEYFQRILNIKQDNGEVWGSMGHCLLMKDDLPKAYTAYQQALFHLPNPKEPKLWYGIGILYDRYGSFEHAEEAFSSVLKMDPNFEKANEIYFRLGIIYKHQRKYQASLECFRYILNNPPRPLTSWDIWFQLGHVFEQDRDYEAARDAYMRVLSHQPDHAKVLQQLGWLHHQPGAPFADQDKAVSYLTKSLETDGSDAQSWYLLGRAFMAGQRYNKAYEAYQQAVYRDGRNPTFWCSIGVLYYQINQYRDALDAYSRAIRLNPYISEVWYNLGSLYESCNNQVTDAIDAYTRAADLDPTNTSIKQRLGMLQNAGGTNATLPPAPGPVDVHPSLYSAASAGGYPPTGSPNVSPRAAQIPLPNDIRDPPQGGRDLPPPPPGGSFNRNHSPGPFRGGVVPPPLQHVDESRGSMSRHAPLAPMETERPDPRDARDHFRDGAQRYEQAAETSFRRHAESPGSPRRRVDAYPSHQPFAAPTGPYSRDRERDDWERNLERARHGPNGLANHHAPSPRMPDHAIHPSQSLRRQSSPRAPPEYRTDYGRPGDGYHPYYNQDGRGSHPPGSDPRDRDYERRYDERAELKIREPTPNGNGMRNPSIARETRAEDLRGPSPAPSSSSRAGSKRKVEKKADDKGGAKRSKEDKLGSKKGSGDKRSLKVTLRASGKEEDATSPMDTVMSSPPGSTMSNTAEQTPKHAALPTRKVDEAYDEGAADALMTLHGDLPPTKSQDSDAAAEPRSSPIGAAAATNEFVPSPRSPYAHKKSSDGVSPKHSSFGSNPDRVRTVIEVLNNPRIDSPLSRSASRTAVESQRSAEVRSDDRAKGSVSPSAAAPKTAGPLGDIAQPAKETMPPATHMQSDASTDASIEARTTELGEGSDPKETIEPRQASATPMADGGDAVMAEAAG